MKRTHQMRLLASSERKLRAKQRKPKSEASNNRNHKYPTTSICHALSWSHRLRVFVCTHCNEGIEKRMKLDGGKKCQSLMKHTLTQRRSRHNGVCAIEWQHRTQYILFVLSHRFDKRSHQLDSIEHEQCQFRLHTEKEKAGSIALLATAAAAVDAAVDGEQWRKKIE